ncbi:3-keto-5-aminohexanoate cleavage protein [Hoeflea poritis]|uniref:3-keto-5-aminohexanoate cleavage protein n=1 Tax=Hoeflea poritis TaxID=2993659 RepID=A0ABT4VNA7_9HYPH|nr:3-keto-5-aminohexanoate cleavage protein [Hoeflea poritis]MDA4846199.1 3-keto-5-aminohexanoate cleavage protein [Hoeflea poritis]
MKNLARIMVAPNGARRGKADHPALPVTIDETVDAARACFAAGAPAIHAHVRDDKGGHTLDAGLYRELIAQLSVAVPDMAVQITTEAVGRYSPGQQRQVVRDVMPKAVSVALREMVPDEGEVRAAREFYHWARDADIAVQHILYEAGEVAELFRRIEAGVIPADELQILFVLGRYAKDQQSEVSDMDPFLSALALQDYVQGSVQWGLCAFGRNETDCLAEAVRRGGHARIGFENSLWNRDGLIAADNAERVRELVRVLG